MKASHTWLHRFFSFWDQYPQWRSYAKIGFVFLSCGLIVSLAWRSLHFYSYHRLFTDSSVFISVSQHINAGKVLYQEVWDHKPPIIYTLNSLALTFGTQPADSIRTMERCLAVLAHLAFYFALLIFLRNTLIALLSTVAFHFIFYEPQIFQGGNLTEEYGVYFLTFALLFLALLYHKPRKGQSLFCLSAGICFSLAALTKEPFVLSLLGWSIIPILYAENRKQACLLSLYFYAGVILPLGLTLLVFLFWGNFGDWIDVIHYNLQYVKQAEAPQTSQLHQFYTYLIKPCWTLSFFSWLGILSVFFYSFVKKTSHLPWVVLFAFIMDCLATMLSGYDIGHYYLQPAYSYVFLTAIGLAFLWDILKRLSVSPLWIILLLFVLLPSLDKDSIMRYKRRVTLPYRDARIGPITQKINETKEEQDQLWASFGEHAKYYVESQLLSPTKYLYIYEHSFLDTFQTTREEKIKRLTNDLKESPPRFIILSSDSLQRMKRMGLVKLVEWIQSHYQRDWGVQEQNTYLYHFIKPSHTP